MLFVVCLVTNATATSFGGIAVAVGFGAAVFKLVAVAWSVVGGFRCWD